MASEKLALSLLCRGTARPLSPWACKGHAQTVRTRYLVGGREQVQQAGTQKRVPVQRRGPHAVRRRRSREQVNQTPEGETEDDVAGMLRYRQKWELFGLSPSTPCHHWDTAPSNAQFSPPEEGACTKGISNFGWWWREVGHPGANPSSVPDQLFGFCPLLGGGKRV